MNASDRLSRPDGTPHLQIRLQEGLCELPCDAAYGTTDLRPFGKRSKGIERKRESIDVAS
jgi:hypothetical protein